MEWKSLLCLIPAVFALLRLVTRRYVFSALTALACAAIALPAAPWLSAALAVSAVGDYFMAHKGSNENLYRLGIAGFFLGHALLIAHAAQMAAPRPLHWILGGVLLALYAGYLLLRILPRLPELLKVPATLYTLISVLGFTCALMTGNELYMLGIGLLLFSDTMIAEHDFVGNRMAGLFILPTYYLCHILVTLSALL